MPQRIQYCITVLTPRKMYQKSDHLKEMSSGASLPSQRFAAFLSHVPVHI